MKLTEENYVGIAEQAIKELCSEKDQKGRLVGPVTTSKIRNLLSMTSDIYNDVVNSQSDKLNAEIMDRINYMKIRFIYEAGREPKVKKLVDKAKILEHLEEIKAAETSIFYSAGIWKPWLHIENFMVDVMSRGRMK